MGRPLAVPVRQGDTVLILSTTTERLSNAGLDLSGARIEFSCAPTAGRGPAWTFWSDDGLGRVNIVDAQAGKVQVAILPEDSRAWGDLRSLAFEITAEWASDQRMTLAWGTLIVEPETVRRNE